MEPVAYGLLGLTEWEWEAMLERSTVAGIEKMVYGARWREDAGWYQLAWQTALLMNAAGAKPRDHDHWTAELLLGRDPLPMDPNATATEEPVDPEAAERILRAKAMLAQAQIKAAQAEGGARVIDVTPPEPT
jgi:hypothetical protein